MSSSSSWCKDFDVTMHTTKRKLKLKVKGTIYLQNVIFSENMNFCDFFFFFDNIVKQPELLGQLA